MIKLNITRFGGRGASSSASKSSKANVGTGKYVNDNVSDFRNWWEDNVDLLADNFEAKYNKPPVNDRGMTNSKWDDFTQSEYEKERKAVEQSTKASTTKSSTSSKVTFSKVSVGDTFKYKGRNGITYNFEVTRKNKGDYTIQATSQTKNGKTTKLFGTAYITTMHNGTQQGGLDFNKITNYKRKKK